jgi:hypothetical protein
VGIAHLHDYILLLLKFPVLFLRVIDAWDEIWWIWENPRYKTKDSTRFKKSKSADTAKFGKVLAGLWLGHRKKLFFFVSWLR